MNPTEDQLDELSSFAERAAVGDGDLDELVIDAHQAYASAVNNEGPESQMRFLGLTGPADDQDLDESVIDTCLASASGVNNRGVREQLRYLAGAHGFDVVKSDLERLAASARACGGRRAVILQDDVDRHGEGCDCGLCDARGKSYGAAVIEIPAGTPLDGLDAASVREFDPVTRLYAPTAEAAAAAARAECGRLGLHVVELD